MMNLKTVAAAAALLTLGVTAVIAAQEPQTERQQLMKKVGGAMGALAGIAKGEKPYDAAVVKSSLAEMVEIGKAFPNHFPAGSQTGADSEASPKIWESMDDFKAKSLKFSADAEAVLAQLPADPAAVGASLQKLGANCGSCHEVYRLKN